MAALVRHLLLTLPRREPPEQPGRWSTPCTQPVAQRLADRAALPCRSWPTRRFLNAWLCVHHAPVILTPPNPLQIRTPGTSQ
ncbi:hypothetical protein [Planotetraspora sp. GP83]|uniref:hypothetical protein n=1 Tax=Planotetraspora sp. GP83 TaxID=3156264 RepID=UPI0035153F92